MHANVRYAALTPGMPMRMNRMRFLGEGAGGDGTAGAGAGTGDAAATAAAAAQAATDAATKATADAAAKATADAAAAAEATNIQGLPAWAQKLITDTRKEAGDSRFAKTAAETKATEADAAIAASKSTMDKIAIALGLKTGDAAPDAAALTAQVAAAQATARDAAVQLAVFKAAGPAGANANALLDRNSFTKTTAGLDPSAADFDTKVTAAILAAVTADPTLKAVLATGGSSVDHAGGTGENGATKPTTIGSAVRTHYGS